MRVFFGLLIFLCFLDAPLWGQDSTSLGQAKIREDFQESLLRDESVEDFKRKYGLQGLSEKLWLQLETNSLDSKLNADLLVLSAQLRSLISKTPFSVGDIFHRLKSIIFEAWARPIDASSMGIELLRNFWAPLLFALYLLCSLQILFWINPIRRDLYKKFGARRAHAPLIILIFGISISLLTGEVVVGAFVLSLIAAVYSRSNGFYFATMIVLCIVMSFKISLQNLQKELEVEAAKEALVNGRNRIEYSVHALDSLDPAQKANWAFWNNSTQAASQILNNAKDSLEKEVLSILLKIHPQNYRDATLELEKLRTAYGEHPTLLFNLSQLYLHIQDLVRAEETRAKISAPDLKFYNNRLVETSKDFLPIEPNTNLGQAFIRSAVLSLDFLRKPEDYSPLSWVIYILRIFIVLLPFLLLFLVFKFRKTISGLCQETGEATSSMDQNLGKLAIQVQQKTDELDPHDRQRFLHMHRAYERKREELILRFSIFFPGSYWASEGRYAIGFFLSAFIYFLIWSGLPLTYRSDFHERIGLAAFDRILDTGWSLTLFGIGIALLVTNFLWIKRKVS